MRPGDPQAVRNLFDDVAPIYDHLNDLLSFGLHRFWKRQLLSWLSPRPGEKWLDLCCGTGDLAMLLARKVYPNGMVLGLDSASKPLVLARKRSSKEPRLSVSWVQCDVMNSGLDLHCFDGVVMSYGLRNIPDPKAGLKEIKRVLKPGSRAGILDFNKLPITSRRASFQKFYLRRIVVPIAAQFGLREHYIYLEESLKKFPEGSLQVLMAKEVGFSQANHKSLAAGLMGALLLKS